MEVVAAKVCSALPGILAATAAATEASLVRQTGGHTVSREKGKRFVEYPQ